MIIRCAKPHDLEKIMEIYASARAFMRSTGNPDQWWEGYPPRELIERDIAEGECRLVCEGDETLAVFYTAFGEDPTYVEIFDGGWETKPPYGVLHRVAVSESARGKGVVGFIFREMLSRFGSIRIDTHEKNLPMQRALEKAGFRRAGTIYIKNPADLIPAEREFCKRVAYEASV